MKSRLSISLLALGGLLLVCSPHAMGQTPGVLYTWASGVQDWFRNFGAANTSATLSNSSGALQLTETSTAAGGSQAFSDGFNTIREGAPFSSGCCGGLDLTGLTSLQFDLGHNGSGNVNVQFFAQASPGSTFVPLGANVAIAPGMGTYTVPLTGLTADQAAYVRTIGINVQDHAAEGNLTWTLDEVRSAGTPLSSRTIADYAVGAADFDGVICNFDCGAISGGNGGQNNSGMTLAGNALVWTDLGGSAGAAVTWGNGTQSSGGSFNARPVDLSNYDFVTIRMSATGGTGSLGVQFYMQTGSGFTYQSLNDVLAIDGAFHDLVFPLAGISNRSFVDTNGINLFGHDDNLVMRIDSVVYSQAGGSSVPEPATLALVLIAMVGGLAVRGRAGRTR